MYIQRIVRGSIILAAVSLLLLLAAYLLGQFLVFSSTIKTYLYVLLLAFPISVIIILKGPVYIKSLLAYFVYLSIFIEVFLQVIAVFDLLPAVSYYHHVPFGKVYWTKEGHGNSIMNRFGWYYPQLKMKSENRKIALIGDSFIQALQIHPRQNIGVALQDRLNSTEQEQAEIEVIAMGMSGVGPAHYFELLKHAVEEFNITSALIYIYLGNDFRNSSSKLQTDFPPSAYVYYRKDDDGNIVLNTESNMSLKRFQTRLGENHHPTIHTFFKTAYSYFVTPQIVKTFVVAIQDMAGNKSGEDAISASGMERDLAGLGLDSIFFKAPLSQDAEDAINIATDLLLKCHHFAKSRNVDLSLVTIPFFPDSFFDEYPENSEEWSLKIDEYDFLLPEKRLIEFAKMKGIKLFAMGEYVKNSGITPLELRSLYFNGTGHWRPEGHQFFAEAVYTFLATKKD